MVSDQDLRTRHPDLPEGMSYWVLASQTCNLFNEDFAKIPTVEWVGAMPIESSAKDSRRENGRNPRLLQCRATRDVEHIDIQCDIQVRFWSNRSSLAEFAPFHLALRDTGSEKKDRQKDTFAGWLARSYTRLELSTEFGDALKVSRVADALEQKLIKRADDIYGIFLGIFSDTEDERDATQALANPVFIKPPCSLEITVVVYNAAKIETIKKELNDLFEHKTLDDLAAVPDTKGKPPKISRIELASRAGLTLCVAGLRVVSTKNWSVDDMNQTIRYTFVDHLSDSGLTDSV